MDQDVGCGGRVCKVKLWPHSALMLESTQAQVKQLIKRFSKGSKVANMPSADLLMAFEPVPMGDRQVVFAAPVEGNDDAGIVNMTVVMQTYTVEDGMDTAPFHGLTLSCTPLKLAAGERNKTNWPLLDGVVDEFPGFNVLLENCL